MSLSRRNVVSTWIVTDTDETASYYPQAGRIASSDPRVHRMYWNCVGVFFSIARRVLGNSCRYCLYTNTPNLKHLGSEIWDLLRELGVEIVEVPFRHKTPKNYYSAWGNQFFILDILEHLLAAETSDPEKAFVILDSDCLITLGLGDLFEAVRLHEILTYDTEMLPGAFTNGLSLEDMRELNEQIGGTSRHELPRYFGGEFFAATANGIARMAGLWLLAWEQSLSRAKTGAMKFNDEAQLLSFVYTELGVLEGTANTFIKRLWTGIFFRNGVPGDERLAIWHVPNEKRFGIQDILPAVIQRDSWFWTSLVDERWRMRLARIMGVPRPGNLKMLREVTVYLKNRLQKSLGRAYDKKE